MKPVTALVLGSVLLIAVYYGRRIAAVAGGDIRGVFTGFSPFKIVGKELRGGIALDVVNDGDVSLSVKGVNGSVYVDSVPLVDVAVFDPFTVQPKSKVGVVVEIAVPVTASAAMTVVRLITGLIQKKVLLKFDGFVEAEGLTIPVKKSVQYG